MEQKLEDHINVGLIHSWTGRQTELSDQTAIRQIEMRLIPLVFTRLYAVSVDRQESISFFMWECKACITRGSSQPLIGHDTWSHVSQGADETSIVNLLVGLLLIRATRRRFFSASSDRRFRTSQRADSVNHLSDEAEV